MKTVVMGYGDIGSIGLKALMQHGYDVLAVFTEREGTAEEPAAESIAVTAAARGIPVFAPGDVNHHLWVSKLSALAPEAIFSFSFGQTLKAPILDIPRAGCFGLHKSLLPRYRGPSPVNWALINGETETGITLYRMTEDPQAGDIVAQERLSISPQDSAAGLHAKLGQLAECLLDSVLPAIKGGSARRSAQDESRASYGTQLTAADGEIDWSRSAQQLCNLVRGVARPAQGAFSYLGDRKCTIWSARETEALESGPPGTVLCCDPLVVCAGEGAIEVLYGEVEGGIYMGGAQLAQELHLAPRMRFGPQARLRAAALSKKRVLILGVDGFIGNALSERLMQSGKYEVHGMDLRTRYVEPLIGKPGFHFEEGDISIHREWLEYHVRKCDIVIPLVAIATPIEYTRNPLRVFELDFEENLRVVRYCVKYGKRIIFPSTSEVYGMCDEDEFDEDNSKLILGPIRMQRWIYSCSKQLLDRVIWAYGQHDGLKFTLFRPFNWIGPKLDSLTSARIGSSRAITQLILNLVEGSPILLIDGGEQKRCFTDISDGIDCLYRVIENDGGRCDGAIINIGNPDNEASIRELAEMLVGMFERHPLRGKFPPFAGFRETESGAYYGRGYQDVQHRRPSIRNAAQMVGWTPKVSLRTSVEQTLDFFLRQAVDSGEFNVTE